MSLLTQVSGVLTDNPVLEKDASLLLRRKLAAAAWVLVAGALFCVAGLAWLDGSHNDDARLYGTLDPSGDSMLLVLTGLLLATVSVTMAALAATTITSERERGTLPLLLVSGLTPGRIVGGKIGALLVSAAPFLAVMLPLFALCSVFLGVDVDAVAVAVSGVFAHAFAAAAAGVWASAVCQRMRSAAIVALLAAAVPTLLGAGPIFGGLVACIDDQEHQMLVVSIVGIAIDVLIGIACLVGAWSALSPKSTERWRSARWLLAGALWGIPLLGTGLLLALAATTELKQDTAAIVFALSFGLALFTQVVATAVTGRRPSTPGPLKTSLLVYVAACVGLGGLWLVMPEHVQNDPDLDAFACIAVLCFFGSMLSAFCSRWLKHPVAVVVVVGAVCGFLLAVPGIFDEFTYGSPPMSFLNPAYALHNDASTLMLCFFYGVVAIALAVGARGRRT